jgi:hypothetical protein
LHKNSSFWRNDDHGPAASASVAFPVGTHYIIEGELAKGGQMRIVSRYVVMPSGIRYDLMTPAAQVRRPADVVRKASSSAVLPTPFGGSAVPDSSFGRGNPT